MVTSDWGFSAVYQLSYYLLHVAFSARNTIHWYYLAQYDGYLLVNFIVKHQNVPINYGYTAVTGIIYTLYI